jgi:hypothetical protein
MRGFLEVTVELILLCNVIKLRRNPSKKRYNIEYFMVLTLKIIVLGLLISAGVGMGAVLGTLI